MSETEAISGIGTQVLRFNGSEYEQIGEIASVEGPSSTREMIDATHLRTTGGYRAFISGLRDAGEVSLVMHFTRAGLLVVKNDFEENDEQLYKIVLPDDDATELSFSGLITGIPLTIPPDDKITLNVTIKVSGRVEVSS